MKLQARDDLVAPPLAELAALDDAAFRDRFAGSPVKRIGRDRFVRNVLIAIGNSGEPALAAGGRAAAGRSVAAGARLRGLGAAHGLSRRHGCATSARTLRRRRAGRGRARGMGGERDAAPCSASASATRPQPWPSGWRHAAGRSAARRDGRTRPTRWPPRGWRMFAVRPQPAAAARGLRRRHPRPDLDRPRRGRRPGARPARGRPAARRAGWIGYLGTTGVYGDRQGGWVDEDTAIEPTLARADRRARAEAAWLASGLPVHIFRLAGIYGPGRNAFVNLKDGTARRIVKPGQVFSRIHVEDIASVLEASIARPRPGAIYNVCDDEPAPPQDVVDLRGRAAWASHRRPRSPTRRPSSRRWRAPSTRTTAGSGTSGSSASSGCTLAYPTYREGLAALLPVDG